MNKETLGRMTAEELREYAKALGITLAPTLGREDMASTIAARRERTATVRALGIDLVVKVKALRDKRVTDLMAKSSASFTDDDAEAFMRLVIGDEQYEMVLGAATEEDGTVDVDALGIVFARLFTSPELKNF